MTRETKIGLIVAGSFLCLVTIVVASKWRRGEPPLDSEEQSVAAVKLAQNPDKPKDTTLPPLPNQDGVKKDGISLPPLAIGDPVKAELERQKQIALAQNTPDKKNDIQLPGRIEFPPLDQKINPPKPLELVNDKGITFPPLDKDKGPTFPPLEKDKGPIFPPLDKDKGPTFPPLEKDKGLTFPPLDKDKGPTFPPLEKDKGLTFPPLDKDKGPTFPPLDKDKGLTFPPLEKDKGPTFPPLDKDKGLTFPPLEKDKGLLVPPLDKDKGPTFPPLDKDKGLTFPPLAKDKEPTFPPLGKDKDPLIPPITNVPPGSLPKIGGNDTPSTAPINIGGVKPIVKESSTDSYVCQAGESSFALLSQKLYGTDKYGPALMAYNRDHSNVIQNGSVFHANPPLLSAGQKVHVPSTGILERDYRSFVPGSTANSTPTIPSSNPIVSIKPPVGMAPPNTGNVIPVSNPGSRYVVQSPAGESILDIAERSLGNRSRWHEIYRINPNYPPQFRIPAGTELKMPGS